MHYWRALKESKFNVVHSDPSTGVAWLRAALCLSDMSRGPSQEARGEGGAHRGLKDHSVGLLRRIRGQAPHISTSVEAAELSSR